VPPIRLSEPDAARHLLHIGAHLLAQLGDLVDEGELGREKRVGGIFDHLGGAPLGVKNRPWLRLSGA
jgi:hypothetical protein